MHVLTTAPCPLFTGDLEESWEAVQASVCEALQRSCPAHAKVLTTTPHSTSPQVRLSNGCNRVTWDEDDGGGKLSLDLNQVMRISVGLETPLMISDELLIASLIR